jgi:hypothetical protein
VWLIAEDGSFFSAFLVYDVFEIKEIDEAKLGWGEAFLPWERVRYTQTAGKKTSILSNVRHAIPCERSASSLSQSELEQNSVEATEISSRSI